MVTVTCMALYDHGAGFKMRGVLGDHRLSVQDCMLIMKWVLVRLLDRVKM